MDFWLRSRRISESHMPSGEMVMARSRFPAVLLFITLATAIAPIAFGAQRSDQQDPRPATPDQTQQEQRTGRNLWIAKFTTEPQAAASVSVVQSSAAGALNYSNFFDVVRTFETDVTQPAGSWKLTGKELSFAGGSAAKRVLIGFGSGRAHLTMEYVLTDSDDKVVWTKEITTKPSFWGSAGAMGGVQNQGKAVDEQSQKLVGELGKFFSSNSKK